MESRQKGRPASARGRREQNAEPAVQRQVKREESAKGKTSSSKGGFRRGLINVCRQFDFPRGSIALSDTYNLSVGKIKDVAIHHKLGLNGSSLQVQVRLLR